MIYVTRTQTHLVEQDAIDLTGWADLTNLGHIV